MIEHFPLYILSIKLNTYNFPQSVKGKYTQNRLNLEENGSGRWNFKVPARAPKLDFILL